MGGLGTLSDLIINTPFLRRITENSLEKGLIPSTCPLCGNSIPPKEKLSLVIHHWGNGSKSQAIGKGNYRRMCFSCNILLGTADFDTYSSKMDWATQRNYLFEHLSLNKRILGNSSKFTGQEGNWSKLLDSELDDFFLQIRTELKLHNIMD